MSNYEKQLDRVRVIIEEKRSALLEEYCETTGADMGAVIYTTEGWENFMEWIADYKLEEKPKKGAKAWCWWKSRNLYYTGWVINGKYEFKDDIGAITMVTPEELKKLQF